MPTLIFSRVGACPPCPPVPAPMIFCHCLMNLCLSLDVCKRSARVILSYLKSKSKVVRSVASFSVLFGRHESIIGNNANFRCSQFNWNFSDFLSSVDTRNEVLYNNYLHDADDSDRCSATLLAELISVLDGLSDVSFF